MTFFVRFKHDYQLARWNYKPRISNPPLATPPETFPLQSRPLGSDKGNDIRLTKEWWEFDIALNPENSWLTTMGSMLFNRPQVSYSISCGGNVGEVYYTKNGHGHLLSFRNGEKPVYGFRYDDYPQFIHKVVCINSKTGALTKPGRGLDVYFALVAGTELWVDMQMVEPFPALPMTITTASWMSLPLRVWNAPYGSAIVGRLWSWNTAQLVGYDPRGSSVFGKVILADGTTGWVCLQKEKVFFTNWKMSTLPPPV